MARPTIVPAVAQLTGTDRPGVTTALFSALSVDSADPIAVVDIEQVVVRGRLVLGVLLAPCESRGSADAAAEQQRLVAATDTAQRVADDLDMDLEVSTGFGDPPSAAPRPR